MQYEQAYSTLRWHVGFNDSLAISGKKSFIDCVQAMEKDQRDIGLDESTDEIIACLESVNLYINGPTPSESIEKPQLQLPRRLVAAISELEMLCLNTLLRMEQRKGDHESISVKLRRALWRIVCAWSAVLDGDIDNIVEHVQLEFSLRSLPKINEEEMG